MKKNKRGPKPLGGIRIILRLTPSEVKLLEMRQQQTGLSRTELIRRAVDNYWTEKRQESNWKKPPVN